MADVDRFSEAENVALLAESIARWRRNNPRPEPSEPAAGDVFQDLLDRICPEGDIEHEAAYERYTQRDIRRMSAPELRDELALVRLRMLLRSDEWLETRAVLISEKLAGARHARAG